MQVAEVLLDEQHHLLLHCRFLILVADHEHALDVTAGEFSDLGLLVEQHSEGALGVTQHVSLEGVRVDEVQVLVEDLQQVADLAG